MLRSLLVLSLLISNFIFAQEYKDGFSTGAIQPKGEKIPVKIFVSPNLSDISKALEMEQPVSTLIYLTKHNTEAQNPEMQQYLESYYKDLQTKGYLILNENFISVGEAKADNLSSYKYILKPKGNLGNAFENSKLVYLSTEFKISDPNEGINIFGFNLRYYGLMFVFAFGFGLLIMRQIFRIDGVDEKYLDPLFTWTLLGTIFGARIGHVIFYEPNLLVDDFWSVFLPIRTKPTVEFTGFSGLASHGATIALIGTTLYYSLRIIKKNPFWMYDRIAIVVAIGGAFVRLGNFFNSEIIGKPVAESSPFAVLFPQQSLDYGAIVPRYPTQLFEAFGYFTLFILLVFLYKFTKKKYQQGWLFGLFFVILWCIRFFVEFLKEPQGEEAISFAGLNTGQILSVPFIIAGFVIMYYSKKNKIEES